MSGISRSAVCIRFYGIDLDPDALTKLLGCPPTSSGKKGDIETPIEGVSRTLREGSWILNYGDSDPIDLEKKLDILFEKLTDDLEIWKDITQTFEANVFCGLFLDGWNEGFELSPGLMKKLADRNLKIGFDLYSPTDNWYNDKDAR